MSYIKGVVLQFSVLTLSSWVFPQYIKYSLVGHQTVDLYKEKII